MPAWDNVQLAGPPNGPAWAQAAAQMMNTVGNQVGSLGDAYQSGVKFNQQNQLFPYQLNQAQYQQNQRDFFQDPNNQQMLQKAMQSGNYAPLMQAFMQTNGTGSIPQAIPLIQRQQLINSYTGNDGGGGQPPLQTGPATNSSASGPENIHGNFSQSGNLSASNTNDLAKLADANGVDLNSFLEKYPKFQPLLDETLTPAQKSMATAAMLKFGGSASTPNRGGINPVAQSGPSDQESRPSRAAASNQLNPSTGEQTSSMTPRQGAERRIAQSAAQPTQNAFTQGSAAAMVPPQFRDNPQAFAEFLRQRANQLRQSPKGKVGDLLGVSSKRDEDEAKALDDRAKSIEEALGKDVTARRTPQLEADTKYYDSLHRGLTGTAMIAAQQKQNIDMLRQVAASPDFIPGAGSNLALTYQRAAAQLGINTAGAAPREIFNQVATRILADQISGLKSMASETGETGARVFKQMIDLEEKANLTHENSLEGIKSQLDIIDRVGDLMMKWANKADDEKIKNGALGPQFDKELRADIAKARLPNIVPQKAPSSGAPPIGFTDQGYRFKGGDHKDRKNWERVSGDRT